MTKKVAKKAPKKARRRVRMYNPPPITGYRPLSEFDVERINTIKAAGDILETVWRALEGDTDADQRWVAIGKTHAQQALMAAARAVAKPAGF